MTTKTSLLSRTRALPGHSRPCGCLSMCCKHTGHKGTNINAKIAQNTIFDELCLSASYQKKPAAAFLK